MTAFGIMAIIVYLPILAPINIANKFQLLQSRFCQLKRASICFSSESNNKH